MQRKIAIAMKQHSKKMSSLFLPVDDEFSVIFVMMVWSLLVCSSSLRHKTKKCIENKQQMSLLKFGELHFGVCAYDSYLGAMTFSANSQVQIFNG